MKKTVKKLDEHILSLKTKRKIITWYDRNISAGTEWSPEIEKQLKAADIILLIISANFLASNYCRENEVPQALARHEAQEACVIPVMVELVNVEKMPFDKLQALPGNGLYIKKWVARNKAFRDIVQGIGKAVDAWQPKPQSPPSGPFLFSQPLFDPNEFYGRVRERETLLNRTRSAGSTSIVGPRRIGKTWLMDYVCLVAPQELGSKYRIGYLDAMAARCSTVRDFVERALEALALESRRFATKQDALQFLEKALEQAFSQGRVSVLCIDEFEYFSHHSDFDLDFFSSLRSMTHKNGLCLLVASKVQLTKITKRWKSSPFFNVFQQIMLKSFDQKDVERFVHEKGEQVGLTDKERGKLLLYGQYEGEYWPISLQLTGAKLLQDKTLAQQDPDYYRPEDPAYWDEFAARLQKDYEGIMERDE